MAGRVHSWAEASSSSWFGACQASCSYQDFLHLRIALLHRIGLPSFAFEEVANVVADATAITTTTTTAIAIPLRCIEN